MTDERKEHILFMAENGEGAPQSERNGEQDNGATERRSPSRMRPPERVAPAPMSGEEPEGVFTPAPEREETPEDQDREWKEKIDDLIDEKDYKGVFGMVFERAGLQDEFGKPEVQKGIQDLSALLEEWGKPEGERDQSRLDAAAQQLKDAPRYMRDTLRMVLRGRGMDEEQVNRLLPGTPVAPTEEGEEGGGGGRDITAPTEEGGEQPTEAERQIRAEVEPFFRSVQKEIDEGDLEKAKEEGDKLMDKLKNIKWKKVGMYGWRSVYISVMVVALTYIALMAKANALAGKK